MGTYDADLQAAVDSASVALDAHVITADQLVEHLRATLAERDVETADDAWLERTAEGIRGDSNYLIDSEPHDFTPHHDPLG